MFQSALKWFHPTPNVEQCRNPEGLVPVELLLGKTVCGPLKVSQDKLMISESEQVLDFVSSVCEELTQVFINILLS